MITREPVLSEPPDSFFAKLGFTFIKLWQHLGRSCLITWKAFLNMRFMFAKRTRQEILVQMYVGGIKSLGVLTIVALFTGMIFALQLGLELKRYGQEAEIGGGVALVMLREMGPFMAALIVSASYGSSVAAQLGTMTVAEEVAALEIMAIDPIKFLVMPRLVAMLVMMPLLAFYTDIMAIVGGAIVGRSQLDVSFEPYFANVFFWAQNKDLYVSLFKALVFGVILNTVACYQGLICKGGAVGVGLATRKTVVVTFVLVLVMGFMMTRLFYG